jgi:hypothetical protein
VTSLTVHQQSNNNNNKIFLSTIRTIIQVSHLQTLRTIIVQGVNTPVLVCDVFNTRHRVHMCYMFRSVCNTYFFYIYLSRVDNYIVHIDVIYSYLISCIILCFFLLDLILFGQFFFSRIHTKELENRG